MSSPVATVNPTVAQLSQPYLSSFYLSPLWVALTLLVPTLTLVEWSNAERWSQGPVKLIPRRHPSCSYHAPSPDQVVLNVPLLLLDEEAEEKNPSERHPKRRRRRFKRDLVLDRPFRPLRIKLYFDSASIAPLPSDKQLFINSSLLPLATGFWEKVLLVRPSLAPIRLSRKCKSNHFYFDPREGRPSCAERCKTLATCGEVTIPDDHLFQCRYCSLPTPNPLTCTASGPPDGEGVTGADFLLYVSAVNSTRCENKDTIAYAAHCQQESELDRPIAGHVNICPNALSTHEHDQEILLSTVKHEILHALGFSAGLYAFFRNSTGQPRSRRNRYNRPLSFNRERGYYDADDSTIRAVVREDWWAAEGPVPHTVHMMVTERVRDEARRHFNCAKLEGAEMENQGGDGTALTHWEKRLFENEAMTGTHTQNPVYSRLTLALMEDSGWYKANYDIAEQLHWGHGLGCEFALKSCGSWIRTQQINNRSPAPFCQDIKHDGSKSLATTRCTDQRDSLALCNLVPYKRALPTEYRNFASLVGVRKEGVRHYGGSVELADFCPYNQEFEWKTVNSSDRRDSRCELMGNAPPEDTNFVMEVYGLHSRCLDLQSSWTERKCGRQKTYSQFAAGCYGLLCKDGRVHIRVGNISTPFTCYYAGQVITVQKIVDGWLRKGAIRCPACDDICTREVHWSMTSLGEGNEMSGEESSDALPMSAPRPVLQKQCLPDSPELALLMSRDDEPLDEPCAAMWPSPHSLVLYMCLGLLAYFILPLLGGDNSPTKR